MSIVKRDHRSEDESLVVASLAPTEWMTSIDSRQFVEMVSGLTPEPRRYDKRLSGLRPGSGLANVIDETYYGYEDGDGKICRLDNNFLHCIVAISAKYKGWVDKELVSSHTLVRASLALNFRIPSDGKYMKSLSRRDKSSIVREAAKSNLERRPMRTSNITGVSPAVADLSVAYLTLLEQLYHLASAYLAVTAQIQELTISLRAVHGDLTEAIADQLQRMQTYSTRITETIDALFPKFQSVMFMLHQVECASEIKNHLAHFNDSGVDAVVAKLPSIMTDAAGEIDQFYTEADIQVNMLDHTDEIDRLLALKSDISEGVR
jgi:hypothetical protein